MVRYLKSFFAIDLVRLLLMIDICDKGSTTNSESLTFRLRVLQINDKNLNTWCVQIIKVCILKVLLKGRIKENKRKRDRERGHPSFDAILKDL